MTLGGACEQEALLQGAVETGENSQLLNLAGKSLESSLVPPFSAYKLLCSGNQVGP